MMDADHGATSENIISITLEVVQLLTGEDYTVIKNPGDHVTPNDTGEERRSQTAIMSPHTPIPEGGSDRKILELTNRIIHLLTGEVWKYLGHSTLHVDVMDRPQQFPPVEPPEEADRVPSEVKKESETCKEGADVEMDDSNGRAEDCSTSSNDNALTDDDTCAPTELVYHQGAPYIKEELASPTRRAQDFPSSVKEESNSHKDLKDSNVLTAADPALQYPSAPVKEESVLFQGGNAADREASGVDPAPQYPSACIKQELASCHEGNSADAEAYTQIDYLVPYNDECSGEDSDAPRVDGNPSAMVLRNDGRFSNESLSGRSKSPAEKSFRCAECPKCFTRNADLMKHQKAHRRSPAIICSDCGKSFTKNSMYIRHQRIHTGEKPFSCSDCGKSFSVSAHLITHQRIHTGEKPFECSDCGKSFNQKASLIKHRRTHTGEKPFVCADCGKCFTSSTNLTLHQRVHTGEKPYPCSVCGKCFRSSPNLISHQRIHTGEKPYSCAECGKFFTNSSVLVRHQRTHTGEKPFLCSECGKSFTRNSQLIKHQMIHAGQRPYSINNIIV